MTHCIVDTRKKYIPRISLWQINSELEFACELPPGNKNKDLLSKNASRITPPSASCFKDSTFYQTQVWALPCFEDHTTSPCLTLQNLTKPNKLLKILKLKFCQDFEVEFCWGSRRRKLARKLASCWLFHGEVVFFVYCYYVVVMRVLYCCYAVVMSLLDAVSVRLLLSKPHELSQL